MATPYTGLYIEASFNSQSSHGQVHPFHGIEQGSLLQE
jgi:hypothetical protein